MHIPLKPSFVLLLSSCVLIAGSAIADVEYKKQTPDLTHIRVKDNAWQPDEFLQGLTIPASYAGNAEIFLDGLDTEAVWATAHEVEVPLQFGTTPTAWVKALYTDEDVIFRVRWADTTEDRLHHPWEWNEELGDYVAGQQVEDSLMFSFEAGCEWFPSFLSGYAYDFDAWHWMAGRTDPQGQALDLAGSMKDAELSMNTPYPSRNDVDEWNLKFIDRKEGILHKNWDELDRQYMIWPVLDTVYYHSNLDGGRNQDFVRTLEPDRENLPSSPDPLPQYEALVLEGNAADVLAKGNWEDGYWTVELRRKRLTEGGTSYDVQFERLTQFSLHIFDQVERLDESSESQRLFLKFQEKEPLPPLLASD